MGFNSGFKGLNVCGLMTNLPSLIFLSSERRHKQVWKQRLCHIEHGFLTRRLSGLWISSWDRE